MLPSMTGLLPLLTLLATASPLAAAPELHLLTMGPGDDLYTRGGHASLLVVERRADGISILKQGPGIIRIP